MTVSDFVTTGDLDDYQSGDADTLIEQAQSAIRSYCGWHIAPLIEDVEVVLDGRGTRHLWLPSLHVTAVSEITDETTTLTSEDYDWSASGYVERRNGYWSERPRQVRVTFSHGYEVVPPDLIGIAVARATRTASSPAGVRRESAGSVSIERDGNGFLADELAILDRYKLPPRT